jgi:tyrosine-protein kinase Etk/Wzc
VRTNLEYVPSPEGRGKVVMVTSYRPNEGKTFCSVNLSAILAKAGKKVLLLEFDLHKPKVATGLGMTSEVGLSTVLIGKMPWREVVQPTQFENFSVILAGPTPPNASELVLSKHLPDLFMEAAAEYDYVIVDTPPVGLITDALLMMRHVDATLFVVNTRFASKDHVNNALEQVLQPTRQRTMVRLHPERCADQEEQVLLQHELRLRLPLCLRLWHGNMATADTAMGPSWSNWPPSS